ncbi:MAG: LytR/AlgR family response regulator transcription factor [Pseudomonadota bacterium]
MNTRTKAMRAVVADDEPTLLAYLSTRLASLWPELDIVARAANGREALAAIDEHQPDVAFLDIRMPGLSGMEVAARITGNTRVVFVTAFDQYAVDAFEHAAVDYLLKPVDDERLQRTIDRLQTDHEVPDVSKLETLLARLATPKPTWLNWIRVGHLGETRIISVDDVLYFRADHKYTSVRTSDAEHLVRKSIKELEAELDPERFWRVHRSTLVNLAHIEVARRDFRGRFTLTLKGCTDTLRVSDTYAHLFRQM